MRPFRLGFGFAMLLLFDLYWALSWAVVDVYALNGEFDAREGTYVPELVLILVITVALAWRTYAAGGRLIAVLRGSSSRHSPQPES
jgi:hypothetical protein